MSKVGDYRLRDWRECGHHPEFVSEKACFERLVELSPVAADPDNRLPSDVLDEDGKWGQWICQAILDSEQVSNLFHEVETWMRGGR